MKCTRTQALVLAAALLSPCMVNTATLQTLEFTGVALPGATGQVFPYDTGNPQSASFVGEPVTMSLSLSRAGAEYYVSHFDVRWSDDAYSLPFITDWQGDGIPASLDDQSFLGFLTQVNLAPQGGSIRISPTAFFLSSLDANFELALDFTFSQPRNPYASFADAVTGDGEIDAFLTFVFDPRIGAYDAASNLDFALTGVRATAIPEPTSWALLLLGFAGVGLMLRRRRWREPSCESGIGTALTP